MALSRAQLYYYNYKSKFLSLVKNPGMIPFYFDRFSKYKNVDNFDILLVSYPKSGRTWLQNILVEIGKLGYDTEKKISEEDSISHALTALGSLDTDFPAILATHDKSSWEQAEPLQDEEQIKKRDFEAYNSQKIVFLHRDPRDVLVSQFYHIKLRHNISKIEKEDLISNPVIGIKKIIFFMNKWLDYAEKNKARVFRMSYEEMKKDTTGTLSNMCDFMGFSPTTIMIEAAIKNSDIKKMQQKQASSNNKDPWTKTDKPSNINSFQSRKGIIGDHKNFFSTEQLSRIDHIIDEFLDKRFGY